MPLGNSELHCRLLEFDLLRYNFNPHEHILHHTREDKAPSGGCFASASGSGFLEKLWTDPENKREVDAFMNNKMCKFWSRAAADSKEANQVFQAYAIQDFFFLADYIKFRALRLASIDTGFDIILAQAQSIAQSADSANEWKNICVRDLGISEDRFDTTDRSVGELAYSSYLQSNAFGKNFFNLHVITIACIYGWNKLAKKLNEDNETKKDNVFFKHWIEPNLNDGPVQQLEATLSRYQAQFESALDRDKRWNDMFRTALRLEVAIFESARDFLPQSVLDGLAIALESFEDP